MFHSFLHSEAFFAEEREQNLKFRSAIKEFVTLQHKLQIEKSAYQCDFSIFPPFQITFLHSKSAHPLRYDHSIPQKTPPCRFVHKRYVFVHEKIALKICVCLQRLFAYFQDNPSGFECFYKTAIPP